MLVTFKEQAIPILKNTCSTNRKKERKKGRKKRERKGEGRKEGRKYYNDTAYLFEYFQWSFEVK
jgi:hypothetical protein